MITGVAVAIKKNKQNKIIKGQNSKRENETRSENTAEKQIAKEVEQKTLHTG